LGVVLYHVSATVNRESILRHGLDWRRMSAAAGVAGNDVPECDGVFLARDIDETEWFVRMAGRHGAGVDVWEVSLDLDFDVQDEPPPGGPLVQTVEGFLCHLAPIAPERLRLRPG
jgi:hypothetical protein